MDFLKDFHHWYLALVLTTPRILVAFSVLPIFAQPIFPAMIRNGVMIILALTLLPLTVEQLEGIPLNLPNMALIIIKEAIIGLALGYAMSLPFWAMRAAGFIMDMQRGAMSALFFSPTVGGMVSPLGNLMAQLAIVMLFVSGGFIMLLETIMLSYRLWPLQLFIPEFSFGTTKFFLQQLDLLLYTTLLVAGPFMGVMLLIDFGTGLVGRFLPQLNIFLVAMPIKSGLVFFMIVLYIPIVGHFLHDIFLNFGSNLQLLNGLFNEPGQ